jgi:outer membrane receptor protein involved in Fe transport
VALANSVAQQYFGTSTYAGLTGAQQKQVATAQALRNGQIGTTWGPTAAPAFAGALPGAILTPSYKFTENDIGYLAVQYGEKGGVAQVVNALPVLAKPEKSGSVELGWKTSTADKGFLFNADVFRNIIHGYQQTVSTVDPLNIATTVSYVGNAPQVDITGFELDTAWNVTHDLRLRASGAYTYAVYQNFPSSPLPAEDQVVKTNAFQSVNGQLLPGASRVLLNLGGEYRRSIYGNGQFHTSFNTAYLSRYNSDSNLSAYAWIPSHSTTDANIGVGRLDQKFDVSVIVKNLFNNLTPQAQTLNSITPAYSRWLGVQFTGRL